MGPDATAYSEAVPVRIFRRGQMAEVTVQRGTRTQMGFHETRNSHAGLAKSFANVEKHDATTQDSAWAETLGIIPRTFSRKTAMSIHDCG